MSQSIDELFLKELLSDKLSLNVSDRKFGPVGRVIDKELYQIRRRLSNPYYRPLKQVRRILHSVKKDRSIFVVKIFIPVEIFPDFNFLGKLLGPKGKILKHLEATTNCKILIRGKGSSRNKLRDNRFHNEEPLHLLITTKGTNKSVTTTMDDALCKLRPYLEPDVDEKGYANAIRNYEKVQRFKLATTTTEENEAKLNKMSNIDHIPLKKYKIRAPQENKKIGQNARTQMRSYRPQLNTNIIHGNDEEPPQLSTNIIHCNKEVRPQLNPNTIPIHNNAQQHLNVPPPPTQQFMNRPPPQISNQIPPELARESNSNQFNLSPRRMMMRLNNMQKNIDFNRQIPINYNERDINQRMLPNYNERGIHQDTQRMPPNSNERGINQDTQRMPPNSNERGMPHDIQRMPPNSNERGTNQDTQRMPPNSNERGMHQDTQRMPPNSNERGMHQDTQRMPMTSNIREFNPRQPLPPTPINANRNYQPHHFDGNYSHDNYENERYHHQPPHHLNPPSTRHYNGIQEYPGYNHNFPTNHQHPSEYDSGAPPHHGHVNPHNFYYEHNPPSVPPQDYYNSSYPSYPQNNNIPMQHNDARMGNYPPPNMYNEPPPPDYYPNNHHPNYDGVHPHQQRPRFRTPPGAPYHYHS